MKLSRISRGTQEGSSTIMWVNASVNDTLLDGIKIKNPSYAKNWILESTIHQTVKLSETIDSTANFTGQQKNIVRDEMRRISWACHIDREGHLILSEIVDGKINQAVVKERGAFRSHVHVDKYTGKVFVTYSTKDKSSGQLFFDGSPVTTEAIAPDFAFFATNQAPIGHVPTSAPSYGLLTYKDRASGVIWRRRYEDGSLDNEEVLFSEQSVGGASLAVIGAKVLAFVFSVIEGRIIPQFAVSADEGRTFTPFEVIELEYGDEYSISPNSGGPTVDFSGVAHFPILLGKEGETIVVDAIVDDGLAVEAIRVPDTLNIMTHAEVDKFPKSSACMSEIMFDDSYLPKTMDYRLGDGISDGVGIIATLSINGKLYSSNSQSGGRNYPTRGRLNHEMLDVAAYSTSECYSRGHIPNAVSMDYIFIEAVEGGEPLSGDLHLETWDMPLPDPVFRARLVGENEIELIIAKDANFIPGRTVFEFDDPAIAIVDIRWDHVRKIQIKVATRGENVQLENARITFEAKSLFYHHRGTADISRE